MDPHEPIYRIEPDRTRGDPNIEALSALTFIAETLINLRDQQAPREKVIADLADAALVYVKAAMMLSIGRPATEEPNRG